MTTEKKGLGCAAKGCIALVVIGIIVAAVLGVGGYVAYNYAKSFIADSPIQVPVKEVTPEQYAAIRSRFEAFGQAVQNNVESQLELTANDINSMIAMEDKWKELKGRCQVRIENDRIFAQVSVPLEGLDPKNPNSPFKGKYLNGSVGVEISINNGEVMMYPRSIEVNGEKAPDAIMKAFSGPDYERSFRESFKKDQDPKIAATLAKIKSFRVEKDRIIIQSVGAPSAVPPTSSDAPATTDQPAPAETAPASEPVPAPAMP